jgi:spoIIIJ-associated protein
MKSAEGEGRTVDEAVDAALVVLGESRRNVDVKVLKETPDEARVEVILLEPQAKESPAPARIPRSRPLAAGPAPVGARSAVAPARSSTAAPVTAAPATPATGDAETVRILVRQLLERMGVRAEVSARETAESIQVDISGRDLGMLIGWRGETLRALQTMTNLLASRHVAAERRVVVDVEKYRQRRENTVREIAERAATQVKVTGDPITLDAMQPFERRAIHLALQDDPAVTTGSIGEEPDRRVVVSPATRDD